MPAPGGTRIRRDVAALAIAVLGSAALSEPAKHREQLAQWLANPLVRRRRIAGAAWALTRDTALLSGLPATAGATVGELRRWFAENPADRRQPLS